MQCRIQVFFSAYRFLKDCVLNAYPSRTEEGEVIGANAKISI